MNRAGGPSPACGEAERTRATSRRDWHRVPCRRCNIPEEPHKPNYDAPHEEQQKHNDNQCDEKVMARYVIHL